MTPEVRDAFTAEVQWQNAVYRAWAVTGVPVIGAWARAGEEPGYVPWWELSLRCRECSYETHFSVFENEIPRWLGAFTPRQVMERWKENALDGHGCDHLKPILYAPLERVLEIAALELLAGDAP